MATDVQRIANALKVPDLVLRVDPTWGSLVADHRNAIRANMHQHFGASSAALLDTGKIPRLEGWGLSIAHSPGLGGWVAVPDSLGVGLDLEQASRLKIPTVSRVCTQEEIQSAPRPELLWPVKEATFKALGQLQPQVMSALTVLHWETMADNFWTFSGAHASTAFHGIVNVDAGNLLALALLSRKET